MLIVCERSAARFLIKEEPVESDVLHFKILGRALITWQGKEPNFICVVVSKPLPVSVKIDPPYKLPELGVTDLIDGILRLRSRYW